MKSLLITAAALAFTVATPVLAQDAGTVTWEGPFVGVHGGYLQGNRNGCGDIGIDIVLYPNVYNIVPVDPIDSCDGADPEVSFDYDQAGGLFGVQGGYNWQLGEMFLLGIEASASITNASGELDGVFGGVGTWNSLFTATAKAGVTMDSFLVYGEGGFASAGATFEGDIGCEFGMNHTGPVVGGGVSFKINETASIDLKYNHVWLGAAQSSCDSTLIDLNPVALNVPTELRTQGSADVVKLGINFQLGQ